MVEIDSSHSVNPMELAKPVRIKDLCSESVKCSLITCFYVTPPSSSVAPWRHDDILRLYHYSVSLRTYLKRGSF